MPPDVFTEQARALAADRVAQLRAVAQETAEALPEPQDKPMSVWWFVCLLIAAGIADLIDLATGGTVGWLIGLLVDLILLIALGRSKIQKAQIKKMWVGIGLETFLPVLDVLPFRTLSVVWAFLSSRR